MQLVLARRDDRRTEQPRSGARLDARLGSCAAQLVVAFRNEAGHAAGWIGLGQVAQAWQE
jgi:hypothetical protein